MKRITKVVIENMSFLGVEMKERRFIVENFGVKMSKLSIYSRKPSRRKSEFCHAIAKVLFDVCGGKVLWEVEIII